MPLVRRDPPGLPKAETATPTVRSAEELGTALGSERDLRRREALLAALLALADASAATALARHLRSEDAGLRNACIETLQAMPAAALPVLPGLLSDPDPDVRLLATEVARAQPTEVASALLAHLLEGETHPNVCGAAVEVLAEAGTAAALPALQAARARFASEAFLPMAIDMVLARIGSGR
ncbi:HEAT repeat domain-containing protein [Methylobacterium sp. J-068]|uniref:HEAT repeat domain-containing protein n=1 Tax=Methylobacterium sp. J-068 TaxID=2836649 RepID=UPI001FB9379C|nr:HEAT repeat domain-containing protein [Methylobacterium sp. J-068]MCJ2035518.1 HEAT repeat domain-containing protein [Methylobacterium sp. J-068]